MVRIATGNKRDDVGGDLGLARQGVGDASADMPELRLEKATARTPQAEDCRNRDGVAGPSRRGPTAPDGHNGEVEELRRSQS